MDKEQCCGMRRHLCSPLDQNLFFFFSSHTLSPIFSPFEEDWIAFTHVLSYFLYPSHFSIFIIWKFVCKYWLACIFFYACVPLSVLRIKIFSRRRFLWSSCERVALSSWCCLASCRKSSWSHLASKYRQARWFHLTNFRRQLAFVIKHGISSSSAKGWCCRIRWRRNKSSRQMVLSAKL